MYIGRIACGIDSVEFHRFATLCEYGEYLGPKLSQYSNYRDTFSPGYTILKKGDIPCLVGSSLVRFEGFFVCAAKGLSVLFIYLFIYLFFFVLPRHVFWLFVCFCVLTSSIQGWIFFVSFFFSKLNTPSCPGLFFSFPSSVWFFFLIKLPTSTTPSPPPHKKLSSIIPVELLEMLSLYLPRALQESF